MNKIKSFLIDHDKIKKGIYISRIDDDIITYDLRMVKPNMPPYLENSGLHTFEHLFATYVRNSNLSQNIIYVGPMGCRTGFYFLTRNLNHKDCIDLIKESMRFISEFNGEIPGAAKSECGNYLDHNLNLAKIYAYEFLKVIRDWKEKDLNY